MIQPSMIMLPRPSLERASSTDMARISFRECRPSFSAAATVCFSADSSVCILATDRPDQAPLSEMPRWIRPLASGEPTRAATMQAPADWPKMVTLFGSPPKAAMFFLIHFRVVMASIRA